MENFLKPLTRAALVYTIFASMAVTSFVNNQTLRLIAIGLLFLNAYPFFIVILKPMVDKAWEDKR
jgi:hypothetical protein